jgi:NAD(P)-dependent dehydrogenase (short-subunit alcohol dehydrogenase family)
MFRCCFLHRYVVIHYHDRASKAALNIINKALLLDLKEQQVQCCCVHPGYVKTDMTGGRPSHCDACP